MSGIIIKVISLIVPLFIIPIFFKVAPPTTSTVSYGEIAGPASTQPPTENLIDETSLADARAKEAAEYEEERQRLLEQLRQQGPNFAHKYYALRKPCGAPCGYIDIIDLEAGEVLDSKYGISFESSVESNIIVINRPKEGMNASEAPNHMEDITYIFKDGKLIEVK